MRKVTVKEIISFQVEYDTQDVGRHLRSRVLVAEDKSWYLLVI